MAKKECGVFTEMVEKLEKANALIEAHKKNVDAVLKDKDTPPEERQKQLMQTFNAAVLGFTDLDKALTRAIKTERETLRREKDRVVKQIYQ